MSTAKLAESEPQGLMECGIQDCGLVESQAHGGHRVMAHGIIILILTKIQATVFWIFVKELVYNYYQSLS